MPKYFGDSPRVSHTISEGPMVKNVPSTHDRKSNGMNPAPIAGSGLRRCASCGKGAHRR